MSMFRTKQFGIIRQLHTIISKETIKPSSPTPLHLNTHNLSILDHFFPNFYMPKVFFYKDYNNGNTNMLKKSLSKCLTQYYPFAGRFPTSSMSCIDCNDEGVEFIEASNDARIDELILNKNRDETFDQLIPDEKVGLNSLLKVQVNYLHDGGAAIAVSVSHRIADGFTVANFINHWASVARGQSPVNPTFISSSTNNKMIKVPEIADIGTYKGNHIAQRFIFSNSKLKELKEKVITMDPTLSNPSRVELLTSLIFKCMMRAANACSSDLKPFNLLHSMNLRNKIIKQCAETMTGNVITLVAAKIAGGSSELMLNEVIVELRKAKMKLQGLKDEQEVCQHFSDMLMMLGVEQNRTVLSSSLCRFPFYDVNFGWGNPVQVVTRYPDIEDNGFIMMDTPKADGIEAVVHLQKEEMPIFEKDEELLAYVED